MSQRVRTVECPCCGYLSLASGEFGEICPLCFWEYDEEVDFRVSVPSVCNHGLTLEEARNNFDKHGACEESLISYVLPFEARSEYTHASEENLGRFSNKETL